jgi:hypothetical protein
MEGWIFYLLVGAIFLYRLFGSVAKEASKPTTDELPTEESEIKQKSTEEFEAFLRDIAQRRLEKEDTESKEIYMSETETDQYLTNWEQQDYHKDAIIEKPKRPAKEGGTQTLRKRSKQTIFQGNQAYIQKGNAYELEEKNAYGAKKKKINEYKTLFKDKEALKKAFIMGEIFKRYE